MNIFPSPQVSLQTSGAVEDPPDQVNPVSILQVELHPSPSDVFPSSQYVDKVLNRFPLPQFSLHESSVDDVPPEQVHPVSMLQVALHPSPFDVFPSSQ